MKLSVLVFMMGFGMMSNVNASEIEQCNKNINNSRCESYLAGVVDGALMFKGASLGERLNPNNYESRALKYRSGKRFQEANRTFCKNRTPSRKVLVSGLFEALAQGNVKNIQQLHIAMQNLMDCQRLE